MGLPSGYLQLAVADHVIDRMSDSFLRDLWVSVTNPMAKKEVAGLAAPLDVFNDKALDELCQLLASRLLGVNVDLSARLASTPAPQ